MEADFMRYSPRSLLQRPWGALGKATLVPSYHASRDLETTFVIHRCPTMFWMSRMLRLMLASALDSLKPNLSMVAVVLWCSDPKALFVT